MKAMFTNKNHQFKFGYSLKSKAWYTVKLSTENGDYVQTHFVLNLTGKFFFDINISFFTDLIRTSTYINIK